MNEEEISEAFARERREVNGGHQAPKKSIIHVLQELGGV